AAHEGGSPTPAQVKTILLSTAIDLGLPASEQGAGLINAQAAVDAAASYNLSPSQAGSNTLLAAPAGGISAKTTLTGPPSMAGTFRIVLTNTGAVTEVVTPTLRTLGAPLPTVSQPYNPTLLPLALCGAVCSFTNAFGNTETKQNQPFNIPP